MDEYFRIYTNEDQEQFIEHLKYPRFKAQITFGSALSDLSNVVFEDDCTDPKELAKCMRMAGEFILRTIDAH